MINRKIKLVRELKRQLPYLSIYFFLFGIAEAKVKWDPDKIEDKIKSRETKSYNIQFRSDENLSDVQVWLTPSLENCVNVSPASFGNIDKEKNYLLSIEVSCPSEGSIHLRNKNKTIPQPLKINIKSADEKENTESKNSGRQDKGEKQSNDDDLCSSEGAIVEFSKDWKRWKEWEYEKPSFDEVLPPGSEDFLGVKIEFHPIWEFAPSDEPRAPDGFLVIHFASMVSASGVRMKVNLPDGVRLFAGERKWIDSIPSGKVKSLYAPIKLCGNYGEFPISVRVNVVSPLFSTAEWLWLIRKHRRDIVAMSPADYIVEKLRKRLEGAPKRPDSPFYSPYFLSEPPSELGEVILDSVTDPIIGEVDQEELGIFPFSPTYEDVEEFPTDSTIEEGDPTLGHSRECYTFKGIVIHRESTLEGLITAGDFPVVGATVRVFDSDGGINPDDFICSTITRDDGSFQCSGCAYDFLSKPDPYIVVYTANSGVKVGYLQKFLFFFTEHVVYSQRLKEWQGLSGGTYDIGFVRFGSTDQSNHTTRAIWVFRWAYRSYLVGKGAAGDIGSFKIVFPAEENKYEVIDYLITVVRRIKIAFGSADAPSSVAHEFGHALMDKLYSFRDWPSPGGNHLPCSNDLTDINKRRGLAWAEGFATAYSLIVWRNSFYCWSGYPWDNRYRIVCEDYEPSTIRAEDDNPSARWIKHFCKDEPKSFEGDQNEGYVASAIWDLWDGLTDNEGDLDPDDGDCQLHFSEGRNACDSASFSLVYILNALRARPQNYVEFAQELRRSFSFDCERRNDERRTSRFNSIFTGDYENCPLPPGGGGGSGGGGGCSSTSIPILFSIVLALLLITKRKFKAIKLMKEGK